MTKNPDEGQSQIVYGSGKLIASYATVVASGTVLRPVPEGQPSDVQPEYLPSIGEIVPEHLNASFGKVWQMVEGLAKFGSPNQPGFYADEIELRLEMMAGGGLRILGSGLEMNTTGGIRVVFRRGKEK